MNAKQVKMMFEATDRAALLREERGTDLKRELLAYSEDCPPEDEDAYQDYLAGLEAELATEAHRDRADHARQEEREQELLSQWAAELDADEPPW